jgi:hypothetical protein
LNDAQSTAHSERVVIPIRQPSNGVPWLEWVGRDGWECRGCSRSGKVPTPGAVPAFAASLGDLKREHARCVPPGDGGARTCVGDPLNPDRAGP